MQTARARSLRVQFVNAFYIHIKGFSICNRLHVLHQRYGYWCTPREHALCESLPLVHFTSHKSFQHLQFVYMLYIIEKLKLNLVCASPLEALRPSACETTTPTTICSQIDVAGSQCTSTLVCRSDLWSQHLRHSVFCLR